MPEGRPRYFGAMTHHITVSRDSGEAGATDIRSRRWQVVCSLIDSIATLDVTRRHRASFNERAVAMALTAGGMNSKY